MVRDVLELASSLAFLDEIAEGFHRQPDSVDPSWQELLNGTARAGNVQEGNGAPAGAPGAVQSGNGASASAQGNGASASAHSQASRNP